MFPDSDFFREGGWMLLSLHFVLGLCGYAPRRNNGGADDADFCG
jgi:hypothetical protein